MLGQRRDDKQRSFLKTLLGQVSPREVIVPREKLTSETATVMKGELPVAVLKNEITDGNEFWSGERTVKELSHDKYFSGLKQRMTDQSDERYAHWPKALQQTIESEQQLALSAMGALVFYLRRTLHDVDLVSQGHISRYIDLAEFKHTLVLDGQTLTNLEIVKNQTI